MFTSYQSKIKEALLLALPIIAGQLGQVLMGFFDTVQIGGLGHTYIAATGFANGIYWVIILLGMGVLFAVSPLVSEAFGAEKEYRAIGVLRSGLLVSVVLSVVFVIVTEIVRANLDVFRHPETDTLLGARYLRVINYSTPFVFFFMCGKQFLDGMGKTLPGMYITLGGLALNCFLNWVLIYGHLGAPAWGIEGAALASGISKLAMTVALFLYIFQSRKVKDLQTAYHSQTENTTAGYTTYVWPILTIGVPAGLQFFWEVAAFSAGQVMSGWISIEAEAAHMIAIGMASITFMVITGFSAAGTILTGFAYGEKNAEEVRKTGVAILLMTLATEVVFALVFVLLHRQLPLLYTNEVVVIEMAAAMLLLAALFQLSDGLQGAAAGLLRGIQDVKMPALIALVSYWGIMVPACYYLAFEARMGLAGIWLGFVIGLTIAAVGMWARFGYMAKRLRF